MNIPGPPRHHHLADVQWPGLPHRLDVARQRIIDQTLFVDLQRIPFLLGGAELARMAAEVTEWAPQFLNVDPVHGAQFALYCERRGITLPTLKFILCSYEFVSTVHRRILQRVFQCRRSISTARRKLAICSWKMNAAK